MPTTDEERIRRERETAEILADIRRGVRELAANAMRIVAGAGKPEEILARITWLAGSIEAYQTAAGTWPRADVVVEALAREFDHDLWLRSTERQQRHDAAMNLVEVGALRMAAARIIGQPVQGSRALSTLRDGLHALSSLEREMEARYAEEQRAATQAGPVRRPTAPSPKKATTAPTRRRKTGAGEPAT